MANEPLPCYHDVLCEIGQKLAEHGHMGLIVIDLSSLLTIQDEYGAAAYDEVRQRVFEQLSEQRGKDYRDGDLVYLDEPRGLRFIFFLDRKRRRALPTTPTDVRTARQRYLHSLVPALERATFPYRQSPLHLPLGYAMAIHNPLVHPDRIVGRAFREALAMAAHLRQAEDLLLQERLHDLIVRERLVTAYQVIARLDDRAALGFEALSRGARGSGLESPSALFGAAAQFNLLGEVDRLCRNRALLSTGRIPSNSKVFVNTLPATIRDPQFRGQPLIDFLEQAQVSPNRIVIEITERLVIENYSLFREAMDYYTDLGMSFAVDDVGAGYSGLEAIARLKPTFLKIDMSLVRDVHINAINREMVKAITNLGHGIGADVIAEGIHTDDEWRTLEALSVDYGQGFLLARPEMPPDA